MLPDIFGLGLSLFLSAFHTAGNLPAVSSWPQRVLAVAGAKVGSPAFKSQDRAVSNWRYEALWNLALSPPALLRLAEGKDPDGVSRCVKLNNYWCIKKAGWNGEIASDGEGHVAFATPFEGATVAALLLRRYYIDYGRHSAYAIVSRWAPAQCGFIVSGRPGHVRIAGSTNSAALRDVAPRGIQNTLRAQWLAGHGRGGVLKRGKGARPLRRSIIADPLLRMMPAPEIAVGSGEHDSKLKPFSLASLNLGTTSFGLGNTSLPPISSCASDGPRIAAYAQHAAAGVAANSNEDLHLFTDDGQPTANLARVMLNMAAVEIGPLSVYGWLADEGIAAMAKRVPAAPTQPEAASAAKP